MPRSRSRSPRREHRRSGSREHRHSRERERPSPKARSRSQKPPRRRSPPGPRHLQLAGAAGQERGAAPEAAGQEGADGEDLDSRTEKEIEMIKIMGFTEFDSTKGRKVEGSGNAYAINVSQKRKYRQYMNRKGGFNRPLNFVA